MVLVMVVSMLVHQEVVLLQIVDLAAAVEVKILQMAVLAVQARDWVGQAVAACRPRPPTARQKNVSPTPHTLVEASRHCASVPQMNAGVAKAHARVRGR